MARPIGESACHPIELIARREALGFTQSGLASWLDVKQPSVQAWESGKTRVPQFAVDALAELEEIVDELVDAMVAQGREIEDLAILIHATDESLWEAHPEMGELGVPALTHRIAAARAARILRREGVDAVILPAVI